MKFSKGKKHNIHMPYDKFENDFLEHVAIKVVYKQKFLSKK